MNTQTGRENERTAEQTNNNATHFIAMSGTHGCLPDSCEVYDTHADAVEALAAMFELGRTRRTRLYAHRYLELRRADGAEYCEITECDCATPEVHSDSDARESGVQS